MGHLLYVADSFVEEAERNGALAVVDSVDDDLSLTNKAPHGSNSWEIVETNCREKRVNTLSNPSLLVCNEVVCEVSYATEKYSLGAYFLGSEIRASYGVVCE